MLRQNLPTSDHSIRSASFHRARVLLVASRIGKEVFGPDSGSAEFFTVYVELGRDVCHGSSDVKNVRSFKVSRRSDVIVSRKNRRFSPSPGRW